MSSSQTHPSPKNNWWFCLCWGVESHSSCCYAPVCFSRSGSAAYCRQSNWCFRVARLTSMRPTGRNSLSIASSSATAAAPELLCTCVLSKIEGTQVGRIKTNLFSKFTCQLYLFMERRQWEWLQSRPNSFTQCLKFGTTRTGRVHMSVCGPNLPLKTQEIV